MHNIINSPKFSSSSNSRLSGLRLIILPSSVFLRSIVPSPLHNRSSTMSNNPAEISSSRLHGFGFLLSADCRFLSSVVDGIQRRTLHTPAETVHGLKMLDVRSSDQMKSMHRSHLLFCRRLRSVVQVTLVPAGALACQPQSARRNGTSMAAQLLSELRKGFIDPLCQ
jgi:hypothetical protein